MKKIRLNFEKTEKNQFWEFLVVKDDFSRQEEDSKQTAEKKHQELIEKKTVA